MNCILLNAAVSQKNQRDGQELLANNQKYYYKQKEINIEIQKC